MDSGKGQIMFVEEVQFKRVIMEWVPVEKVKDTPSVPKSEKKKKQAKKNYIMKLYVFRCEVYEIIHIFMCSLVNC